MKLIDVLQKKRTEESNIDTDTPPVACDGVVWIRTTTVTATGPTTRAPIFGRLGENPQGETPAERKINEYTDDLRDLADSDLPAAWVAEELLAVVDDRGDAV